MKFLSNLKLSLIPQPHKLKILPGCFSIPVEGTIFIDNPCFLGAAEKLRNIFGLFAIRSDRKHHKHLISIHKSKSRIAGFYSITINRELICITARDSIAAHNAVRTMSQIRQQCYEHLPCLHIEDRPDFPARGIYYDVTRGRVPEVERIKEQISLLASMKINHYQLYFEHTCFFPSYPFISKAASPYSANDIIEIDKHCRSEGVDLIPSLATFGHMTRILNHPGLREMSEDLGKGLYDDPRALELAAWKKKKAGTISPANPETYKFLARIFDDFLPLFTSKYFNICCDEVFDLGLGQSGKLCRQQSVAKVFLKHVKDIHALAARHGKRIMMWGDMLHKLGISRGLPGDIIILDWNYNHDYDLKPLKHFTSDRRNVFSCPGTSSWVSLFPRIHEASANIALSAAAAKRMKAAGLLTADWGDAGHANFMEYSWLCYAFAADKAWNAGSDSSTLIWRFCKLMLKTSSQDLIEAIIKLGDISHTSCDGKYQSIWWHILNDDTDSPLFNGKVQHGWISRKGVIARHAIRLNPSFALKTINRLKDIRSVFTKTARQRGADPQGLLPYWIFAVDMTVHACMKLQVFTSAAPVPPGEISALRADLSALTERFRKLWMDRNRKSELRTTLKRFRSIDRQYQLLEDKQPVVPQT